MTSEGWQCLVKQPSLCSTCYITNQLIPFQRITNSFSVTLKSRITNRCSILRILIRWDKALGMRSLYQTHTSTICQPTNFIVQITLYTVAFAWWSPAIIHIDWRVLPRPISEHSVKAVIAQLSTHVQVIYYTLVSLNLEQGHGLPGMTFCRYINFIVCFWKCVSRVEAMSRVWFKL